MFLIRQERQVPKGNPPWFRSLSLLLSLPRNISGSIFLVKINNLGGTAQFAPDVSN